MVFNNSQANFKAVLAAFVIGYLDRKCGNQTRKFFQRVLIGHFTT